MHELEPHRTLELGIGLPEVLESSVVFFAHPASAKSNENMITVK
jgi:hypothetical protein